MHWANQYVGKPWTVDGFGPHEFNCWGLLWFIYAKHYGVTLPQYEQISIKETITAADKAAYMRVMQEAIQDGTWEHLAIPVDGCAVAMSSHTQIHHVGIFLNVDGGRILHAARGKGVLCQSLPAVRVMYNRIEFYLKHPWPVSPKPA